MKSVELNLNKRLLIVESEDDLTSKKYWYDGEMHLKIKFICKGSDLTEDIAKEFIPIEEKGSTEKYPKAFLISYKRFQNALIDVIQSAGYHWGENPVKEIKVDDYYFYEDHGEFGKERLWDGGAYQQDLKEWQEAESRTFTPDKCIIFKIL